MLKEVIIKETIKILEQCECLEEPMIIKREDKKDLVIISIEEYNELFKHEFEIKR